MGDELALEIIVADSKGELVVSPQAPSLPPAGPGEPPVIAVVPVPVTPP
jgi:hypothetical protein